MPHPPAGDGVDRQSRTPLGGDALSELGSAAGEEVGERMAGHRSTGRQRPGGDLLLAGQCGEGAEGAHVTDPAQHHGRAEEGRKPVGMAGPTMPGLGEILQAGDGDESLTTSFADHRREVGQRRDVGHLVQRQQDRWCDPCTGAALRRRGRRWPGGCPRSVRPPSAPPEPGGGPGRRCRRYPQTGRTVRHRSSAPSWLRAPVRSGTRRGLPMLWTRCRSTPSDRWPRCRPAGCGREPHRAPSRRRGSAGRAGPDDGQPRSGGCACRFRRSGSVEQRRQQCLGPFGPVAPPSGPAVEASPPSPATGPWTVRRSSRHTTGAVTIGGSARSGLRSIDPVGSKSQALPMPERAATVASSTSGLVEVETTAPLAAARWG